MLAQNQDKTIWTIFVTWKFWLKTKTVFFQNWFFQNLFFQASPNTKTRYLWEHSVYGYDPLHIHGEISMLLTLSTKSVLVNNTCILWIPKTKPVFCQNETSFLKWKFFYENSSKSRVCVYNILEQSTNYSILYILI